MYNLIMYILELIAKILTDKKNKSNTKERQKKLIPPETDYEEKCNHVFLPLDSTGETLACTKCGLVVKNDPLRVKPKNPFL